MARLQIMPTPDGWNASPWRSVQAGCLVLAAGWGAQLHRLGWSAAEAFGLDPVEPMNRDRWGAGLLVGWSDVVEVREDRVRMVGADGAGRKYWRKPLPLSVPVWDAVRWVAWP